MFPAGMEITGEEEHPSKDNGCVVMCQECMGIQSKVTCSESHYNSGWKHCNFANAENENFMENT